ncbi:MAG: hypothetical protein ABI683_16675 [Ginsengibacter sp.]
MKILCLAICFTCSFIISYGQNKEKQLLSYLQQKIIKGLPDQDSLVIDQISERIERYNWQAVIKAKGNSCVVIFLPPQVSRDTMVLPNEVIVPLNIFTISKKDLIVKMERIKEKLNKVRLSADASVDVFVTQQNKMKRFQIHRIQELYDWLLYNN